MAKSYTQKDCFKELDVEKYEIVATLDAKTSDVCKRMDGKVFDMKEYQIGITAPPFHPWCRTVTCPFFDDEFTADETRAARGEDGKTYQVPAELKYQNWVDCFVNHMKDPAEFLKPTKVERTQVADHLTQRKSFSVNSEQNYKPLIWGEAYQFGIHRNEVIEARRIYGYDEIEIYATKASKVSRREVQTIVRDTNKALDSWGISRDRCPQIVIAEQSELRAYGKYDPVSHTVYYIPEITTSKFKKEVGPVGSIELHEMWHLKQAERFRARGWQITSFNKGQYLQELCAECEKKLDRIGINKYNVNEISQYAAETYALERYDEVEAEYMVKKGAKQR